MVSGAPTRRQLLASTLAAASVPSVAVAQAGGGYSAADYARATVIDACGAPGAFMPAGPPLAPLSARALADLKRSGLTAINCTVSHVGNEPAARDQTFINIAWLDREIAANPEVLVKVRTMADLKAAKASGRVGLIYGFQDTALMGTDLTWLDNFHDAGVRIVQLTYNKRNLVGDGCLEPPHGGLSRLGFEAVAEINKRRMLVDVAHAGPRTISDAIAASTRPIAISHTGCRALADLPRNVADEQLKALAAKGGVVGIYLMTFLRTSGQPAAEDVIRHIEHALKVCGEDHVGIGTDGLTSPIDFGPDYVAFHKKSHEARTRAGFAAPGESADVYNFIKEYNDARRFELIGRDLARRGHPPRRIDKILGGNFARLFEEAWGG